MNDLQLLKATFIKLGISFKEHIWQTGSVTISITDEHMMLGIETCEFDFGPDHYYLSFNIPR